MKKLIISPLAEIDLKDAYQWYELNKVGLGDLFLKVVKDKLHSIRLNPRQEDAVVVFSVYHSKRNPKNLIKRIGK